MIINDIIKREEMRIRRMSDEDLKAELDCYSVWIDIASREEINSGETNCWADSVILLNGEIERRQEMGAETK